MTRRDKRPEADAQARRVAVFCGSYSGKDPRFREAAEAFGAAVAKRGWGLVYGGGRIGMMGFVADAALRAGGEVIGVIPRFLIERELGHGALSELIVVDSMHARKSTMAELSSAFVALPGGIGTLEEIFEVWTWTLLGLHAKPCGLLNVGGYFDPLLSFLDRTVSEGFVSALHREMLQVAAEPARLLDLLAGAPAPPQAKWVGGPSGLQGA